MSTRILDQVQAAAASVADLPAVTFADVTHTWSEFYERCGGLAGGLRSLGVKPGDRVAVLSMNTHWQFMTYFAPSFIGAMFVPVNYRLSLSEMMTLIEDAEPTVLMCDDTHLARALELNERCTFIKHVVHTSFSPSSDAIDVESLINEHLGFDDFESGSDDDPVTIVYTSGTTGRPKGVMLSHNNMTANSRGAIPHYGLTSGDVSLLSGPMFHTAGGARVFMSPIAQTHTIVMDRFEVVGFLSLVEKHRIEITQFVPTMLAMVLDHPEFDRFDTSSISLITYGSAPMPTALVQRVIDTFPGVRLLQAYGMTEASPVVTVLPPSDHDRTGERSHLLQSVGKVISHVDMRLIDDSGNPVATGDTGQIVVRGPNITKGYWRLPEETNNAIVNGWYHTGDAGWFDDEGYLFLAGRTKDMIVSGGENVYPIETENVLSLHPGVDQCAVIGVPDDKWGEVVHAVVKLAVGAAPTERELIDYCREEIAHYKCPRSISFRDEALPLSATNKVLKPVLRDEVLRTLGGD